MCGFDKFDEETCFYSYKVEINIRTSLLENKLCEYIPKKYHCYLLVMQTVSMMNNRTIMTIKTVLPTAAGMTMIRKLVVEVMLDVGDEE